MSERVSDEQRQSPGSGFARLVEIMARLRAPGGCPWDREQNFDTIKPYLLEETYEVMDAIDARDWEGLADELGDLLLQAVFFAQMASEEGRFDIARFSTGHQQQAGSPPSACLRRWGRENLQRCPPPLGRDQSYREREQGRTASPGPIDRHPAFPARTGGSAKDRRQGGRSRFRLGKYRAGVRQAARRAGRDRRSSRHRQPG